MPSCSKTPPGKKSSAPDPSVFLTLYNILKEYFGPSGWWPGDSPLEVAIGAVLTQNTSWTNVEKAIHNLKSHSLLDVRRLHSIEQNELAVLLRPSGYYNIKAQRLKNLIRSIMESSGGDMDAFLDREPDELRNILLCVNGIGKETADSICCYAAGKMLFVVDAYTRRILLRHGLIDESSAYDEIRQLFEKSIPRDLSTYKDLHAYLVFLGKDYCRPTHPRCGSCPLEQWHRQVF